MTRQSAKFTIWAGHHSPTTGGFTCHDFFSERQDYKGFAASRLRTDQVVFLLPNELYKQYSTLKDDNNQKKNQYLKKFHETKFQVVLNFIVNSSVLMNELFQLLRSSLHVRGFELSEHRLRWSLPVTKSIKTVPTACPADTMLGEQETAQVKQLQNYSYFIYCFTLNNATLCLEIQ